MILENFSSYGLSFTLDGFRMVYSIIFTFMWVIAMLISLEYSKNDKHKPRYYIFSLITYLATIGVFLSADFFTTFLFFEMMSLVSFIWVAQDEKKESLKAANTYLAVAIIGGLVMLMGLFLLQSEINTLRFSEIAGAISSVNDKTRIYIGGICMFIGFAAKAGVYPLHIWLPKAHPVAPAPASALLSGALTKSGVFGIVLVTIDIFKDSQLWGKVLLALALMTMFLGAVLALCSNHIKKILACSSVSQIGFILSGVSMMVLLGEHNTLAARGVFMHMINHSLLKLVLFSFAGIIMMKTHIGTLNELKGFGRGKKALHFGYLMGAFGIAGIPFWNGYISKTLLHESIVECHHLTYASYLQFAEWVFLLSGGITVAYMLKIYIAIFIERNKEDKYINMTDYASNFTKIVFILSAILLPIIGLVTTFTDKIMDTGADFFGVHLLDHAIHYFSWVNLKGAVISISLGLVIYIVVIRKCSFKKEVDYKELWPKWFDLEFLVYKPILIYALPFVMGVFSRVADSLVDGTVILLRKTIYTDRALPQELDEGTPYTHLLGAIIDNAIKLYDKIFKTNHAKGNSYEHKLALFREREWENAVLIGRSLSFGLFMFCLGLCLILIYLLIP